MDGRHAGNRWITGSFWILLQLGFLQWSVVGVLRRVNFPTARAHPIFQKKKQALR